MAYVLKDSQETDNDYRGCGNTAARKYVAGSFTAGSAYTLKKVALKMSKNGAAPLQVATLYIYSDNGSGGSNVAIATSTNTVAFSTLPYTPADWTAEWLFSGLSLSSGTKYHIVIMSDVIDASNNASVRTNNAASGQALECDEDGVAPFTELDSSGQFNFRTYSEDTDTYTVTYDGNGNTGGTAPTDGSSPYTEDAEVTVLGNTGSLVKTDYLFGGWNTQADGNGTTYQPAATFNMPAANVVLYARWVSESPTGKAFKRNVVSKNKYVRYA